MYVASCRLEFWCRGKKKSRAVVLTAATVKSAKQFLREVLEAITDSLAGEPVRPIGKALDLAKDVVDDLKRVGVDSFSVVRKRVYYIPAAA